MLRPGILLLLITLLSSARAALSPEGVEFFESRIRPVLAQDCYECHRSGGKKKGGLVLDFREGLLKGGESGPVIVPGDPKASLLIKAIRHEAEDLEMPKARAKLEDSVIADFEKWVRMGAPDPRDVPSTEQQIAGDTSWKAVLNRRKHWWSFQPIQKISPPANGAKHPIDQFIRARLEEAKLAPSPVASQEVLVRRLSFALRGLPPTREELHAGTPYEELVDSFLSSPRFGERWARHWMDWYRYADSHGSEGDATIPFSWRYRDYLIRALNSDVPYDQLLREQVAGDQLKNPRVNRDLALNESALGIGHLRMVFHGYAPTDALEEKVRFIDDEINVVSKAALGITISCARCHDHKFDPISQADYYAWHGIFASGAPGTIGVDAPSEEAKLLRAKLSSLKAEVKLGLAREWLKDSEAVATRISQIEKKDKPLLLPFADTNALSKWTAPPREFNVAKQWNLSNPADFQAWNRNGSGTQSASGEFVIAPTGTAVVAAIFPSGAYSTLTSTKERAALLSPKFFLNGKYDLWVRAIGDGGSVLRYVVQNYPRDGSIYPVTRLNGDWKWIKHPLDYWEGDRVHVEISTAADQATLGDVNATRSSFGIREVMFIKQGEAGPSERFDFAKPILKELDRGETLTNAYSIALREAIAAWEQNAINDEGALLLDQAIRSGLLRNNLEDFESVKSLVLRWREEESKLPIPTRAPGLIETEDGDQPLFVRGNPKQPAAIIPRHFLEAIDGKPYASKVNARLQLAEDLVRTDNPLTARVIVNRVWHHLFGRGIVATPDNFGRLGQQPSHPELLDYLATWFVENGSSIKKLIRFIVTSETWKASSEPSALALEKDPDNALLSHFSVRRLEAEAIRDTILAVSGQLKADEMYGPPISGKTPRRSVYLRVKRNDLDPFMAAFDAPAPASTTGKRDVTNVPGQSLLLLNDPFVIQLAESWARHGEVDTPNRIARMFEEALGRKPLAAEVERCERMLESFRKLREQETSERLQLGSKLREKSDRLKSLMTAVKGRVLANRPEGPAGPKAIAAWDFTKDLRDQIGSMHGTAHGNARIENGELILDGKSHVATAPTPFSLKAKTLEAWVRLSNLDQQGGGVFTIQDISGNVFDSIVFGEQSPRRWISGSDFFRRTQNFDAPAETGQEFVHLAISYSEDGTITAYRNGVLYGKPYKSSGPAIFEASKAQALFGLRHGEAGGNRMLTGSIRKAALYDHALSAEEIRASFAGDPTFVSSADLQSAMTADERAESSRLEKRIREIEAQLKQLDQRRGLESEWADFAHGIFNLKEFVYVR